MNPVNAFARLLKEAGSGKKLFSIFIPALLWGDLFEAQAADTRRVYRPTAAQLRIQQQQREREARIQAIRKQQKTAGVQAVRPVQPIVTPAGRPVRQNQAVQPAPQVRIRYIWYKGSRFILVQDIANFYGMNIIYSRGGLVLRSRRDAITLQYDKRLAVINRVSVYLTHPPVLRGALVYLEEKDFLLAVDPVIRNAPLWKHPVKTILIDPGHGGRDQGAPGVKGVLEKNITLSLGHKVAAQLRKCGYRVFMTRIADINLTLQQRVMMCEKLKPDLYISIHCNAVGNRRTMGIETYAATPQGAASTSDSKPVLVASAGNSFNRNNYRLAYEVQKNLLAFTSALDRGVRHARFFVIRNAVCPAILIETGFLTHPQEGMLLNNATYQDKLVNGIVSGVMAYTKASVPPGSPLSPALQKGVPPAGKTVVPVVRPAGKTVVPVVKPVRKTTVPAVKPVAPAKKAVRKTTADDKPVPPAKKAVRKTTADDKPVTPAKKAVRKKTVDKPAAAEKKDDSKKTVDKPAAPVKKGDSKNAAPEKKDDSKQDTGKQAAPAKKNDSKKDAADKPAVPEKKDDSKQDAADKPAASTENSISKPDADKQAAPVKEDDSKKAVPAVKPDRKTVVPAKKTVSKTDAGKKSVR